MRMLLRRLALLALSALLVIAVLPPAAAEDCFTLDVDTLDMDSLTSDEYVSRNLSAQAQGIRVVKYISDSSELAARVRLTITRMDNQALLFDKDYGYQSGVFDSEAIYLPYVDSYTVPYLVTLYVEDMVYAMPFMHLRARLQHNGGCTTGARLGELDPALNNDWLMGTMVDLNELRAQGYAEIDVCASGCYIVGRASLTMQGDMLTVQLGFFNAANVELNYYSLYIVTDCSLFTTSDISSISLPSYTLGQAVDVSGADSALIYMPMQLSYDPDQSLRYYTYDVGGADYHRRLFDANRSAAYMAETPQADAEGFTGENSDSVGDGWDNADGWDSSDGWDNGVDGWDSGDSWDNGVDGWDSGDSWDDGADSWDSGNGWDDGGWADEGWDTDGDGWIDSDEWQDNSGWDGDPPTDDAGY